MIPRAYIARMRAMLNRSLTSAVSFSPDVSTPMRFRSSCARHSVVFDAPSSSGLPFARARRTVADAAATYRMQFTHVSGMNCYPSLRKGSSSRPREGFPPSCPRSDGVAEAEAAKPRRRIIKRKIRTTPKCESPLSARRSPWFLCSPHQPWPRSPDRQYSLNRCGPLYRKLRNAQSSFLLCLGSRQTPPAWDS